MYTYQLQSRAFIFEGNGRLQFPATVVLEAKLSPGTSFGTEDRLSRTLVLAREGNVIINPNSGRWLGQSRPPLEQLEVITKSPTTHLSLTGDVVKYEFQCASPKDLEGMAIAFKWILPPLLNLEFPDPPTVEYVRGSVGNRKFRWEINRSEWQINMRTVTAEKLEKHFVSAFEGIELFNGAKNRRLAAALSYFYIAVRLNVAGDSPWEFMAESILNYAKCLKILFVSSENSRDDIRRELHKLNFSKDEIEGDFIPIILLRSQMDVAHPKISIFKERDLKIIYQYIALAESRIRELLSRVLARVADGRYTVLQHSDLILDANEQKHLNRLVKQMESRLGATAE